MNKIFFIYIFIFIYINFLSSTTEGIKKHDINKKIYLKEKKIDNDILIFNLNGIWKTRNSNSSIKIDSKVPGQIHIDLINAGILKDPYYRYNDVLYRWVAKDDWNYQKTFIISDELYNKQQILLICEGLDTVANIFLNEKFIGNVDNMFREWIFNIKKQIQKGENNITIQFESAIKYASKKKTEYPYEVPSFDGPVQHGEPFRNFIRKEQCSFSWDWGPAFLPQGIWRSIKIIGFNDVFMLDTEPQVLPSNSLEKFKIKIKIYFITQAIQPIKGTIFIDVAGKQYNKTILINNFGEHEENIEIEVQNVNLWWPRGYGEPNLYLFTVTFISSKGDKQIIKKKIGFRKIELVTEPIKGQNGRTFFFKVNNIPIFAKGANFIPPDCFEPRVSPELLKNLLQSAADANMNIVRNWGGGIYQHDSFYEICDEIGLMVWEEFMFACSLIPRDDLFLKNVKKEVEYQVRRLIHHPSIIVWSGNNENEVALEWSEYVIKNRDRYLVDYVELYINTIYSTLMKKDQSRPFWPSSPSNGPLVEHPYVGIWGNPQSEQYGDVHYYNYDKLCTDISHYPKPRFASEYGFQSYPSFETLKPISLPEDWFFDSSLMIHRQHSQNGNNYLINQIKMHFPFSLSSNQTKFFLKFIYLTQYVQALCIKSESEHYRRGKILDSHTMGAIYWQLNDIWQAPTWSSIEYGGRWKILHYYAKNFFSPILITSTQILDNIDIYILSDLIQPLNGYVTLDIYLWKSGEKINTNIIPFSLKPLEGQIIFQTTISKLLKGKYSSNECVLVLNCLDKNETQLSNNIHYFTSFVNVSLNRPTFRIISSNKINNDTAQFIIQSNSITPFVTLDLPNIKGRFSDNGFLLFPNIPKTIQFYGWQNLHEDDLKKLTIISLYEILYT